MMHAATVYEPGSGRRMDVYTTQPGLQVYSGNHLDGTDIGKEGKSYDKHYGFCLETQHFPDSPHHSNFPPTELAPGQTYRQTSVFRFSIVTLGRHL
jgi:galactose mutarotase-like enzyme